MIALRRWFAIRYFFRIAIFGLAVYVPNASWAGEGFQPVSPDELKIANEPLAPGAPAIILYRQVDRDDSAWERVREYHYVRIKILTEEGRKHADVELPYFNEAEDIVHIKARTVKPDGSIVNFDGKVFAKSLVKSRQGGWLAKTFTLPAVEVGGIIEYFYTVELKSIYDSHWILNTDLFTKSARFSLKSYTSNYAPITLRWSWQGLPPGALPKEGPDHVIRMDASNIPAFQTEDFMPPENELKARVDFIYSVGSFEKDAAKFWQKIGKSRNQDLENFIGKHKAMEQAAAEIVSPNDPPETKLRKIYDRVQQMQNKSYEVQETEQEEKRDKQKIDENVEDVWKRGYGDAIQLTWLYLALVKAAGFEAYGCWVSSRQQYFFHPNTLEDQKLNTNVVLVKLNGKDLYLDPGAEFTPFGMLPWNETGVQGLRLDKNGGSLIQTELPQSSESRLERKAALKLSNTGDLRGKLTVTYTGLEAMYHRLEARNTDEIARKKLLEEAVQEQIPAGVKVELTNKPDWSNSETPLVAEFDLEVPGWAVSAGKRRMVPAGLFAADEKHTFEHANRVHPIYFEYPFEKLDDITIELSPGWQVASVPPAQAKDAHVIAYSLKAEGGKEKLHLTRKLAIDILVLDQKYYTTLRNFFELVRTGDEQQIVLQPDTAAAGN